jgi:hypothetical protein
MVIRDIPKSGRSGDYVFYMRRNKLCRRRYVIPTNVRTPARRRTRRAFGAIAKAWNRRLTEAQYQAWLASAAKVRSHPRLGQSGPLTGQQHFEGINSARARIGLELLLWPPARVVFGPNPVGQLAITQVGTRSTASLLSPQNGDAVERVPTSGGIRLLLKVTGPVTEHIMVFAQAPCSLDRKKWRHGACLGLLPLPQAGEGDITDLYVQQYGQPEPGKKVFIRTRQQKNGWEGRDHDLAEVVPAPPPGPLARLKRMRINQETRLPSTDLAYLRRPDRPRIPQLSPSISVGCTMHKGVVLGQHLFSTLGARVVRSPCAPFAGSGPLDCGPPPAPNPAAASCGAAVKCWCGQVG